LLHLRKREVTQDQGEADPAAYASVETHCKEGAADGNSSSALGSLVHQVRAVTTCISCANGTGNSANDAHENLAARRRYSETPRFPVQLQSCKGTVFPFSYAGQTAELAATRALLPRVCRRRHTRALQKGHI